MKFNLMNLEAEAPRVSIDAYRPPETLGKPKLGKEEQRALDACFEPVKGMLSHALETLSAEGMPSFLGYTMLCGLTQNGLIRAGITMRAKEMTRKWGKVVGGEDERNNAIERELLKYNVKELFRKAAEKNGFLGGCLLYLDTGDDERDLAQPLTLDARTFARGSLKRLLLIDPYVTYAGMYNATNPLAANYYAPSVWYIQGIPVHASRVLQFRENDLPNLLKPSYNFFGLPLAQTVLDAVGHYTRNRESASEMLEKISLTVFKTDMSDVLTGGGDLELKRRIQYFIQNRSFRGVATIDKETEDLAIINQSLAGVVDIVRQSMEYVAAMFNEPCTKLWGISPAGLNATGDADLRNHYDNIASLQEQQFAKNLNKLLQIFQLNLYGDIDSDLTFEFAPLSEDDERARAEVNKMKAETADIYAGIGAIAAEEIRDTLINDNASGFSMLNPIDMLGGLDDEEKPANTAPQS